MPKHIEELLSPYLDGELSDKKFQVVKSHLASCEKCAAEFSALKNVSNVLHEGMTPIFPASDIFSRRVMQEIPDRETEKTLFRRENIHWLLPISIGVLWMILSSLTKVNSLIITSFNLDLYNWVSQLFVFPSWFDFNLLSQFGMISTNSQSLFTTIESLISSNISFIVIKVSLSLIYLSWMIVWLSQQKRFYYFSNNRSKKY